MVTFYAAQLIPVNFEESALNWLRSTFDAKEWQTLHNTASNGQMCPHLVNDEHVWSTIWSMNDFVHIDAEVRDLGLGFHFMAGMELWGKIVHIWH